MTFGMYCRQAFWDFLLVVAAAVPLTYVVMFAFKSADYFCGSVVPAIVVVLLLLALFVISFNKRSLRIGIPLYILVCIIGMAACAFMGGNVFFLADMPGNYFIGGVIVAVVPTLVFTLSRKLTGCALLFAFGAFTCAWVQFFYKGNLVAYTVAFLVSALALIVYKNYQLSIRQATSTREVSFVAGFATSLAVVAVPAAIGALIWFAIIAPMNPGVVDLKLITEYRALETVKVVGVSAEYQTPNIDMTSDDAIDQERTTDQLIIDPNGRLLPTAPQDAQATAEQQAQGTYSDSNGLDEDSLDDLFDVQDLQRYEWLLFALLGLILIGIVAYFVGRRFARKRRLNRIRKLSPSDQVEELYRFLVNRFERIGMGVPAGATLAEFAKGNQTYMEPFVTKAGDDFVNLSEVYSEVAYGRQPATQEQADAFARFYGNFWKAARRRLGNARYLAKSFRL